MNKRSRCREYITAQHAAVPDSDATKRAQTIPQKGACRSVLQVHYWGVKEVLSISYSNKPYKTGQASWTNSRYKFQ